MTGVQKPKSVAATRLKPARVAQIIAWTAAVTAATAAGMARLASADEAPPSPEPAVPTVTTSLVQAAPLPKPPVAGLVIIRHDSPTPAADRPAIATSPSPAALPPPRRRSLPPPLLPARRAPAHDHVRGNGHQRLGPRR